MAILFFADRGTPRGMRKVGSHRGTYPPSAGHARLSTPFAPTGYEGRVARPSKEISLQGYVFRARETLTECLDREAIWIINPLVQEFFRPFSVHRLR